MSTRRYEFAPIIAMGNYGQYWAIAVRRTLFTRQQLTLTLKRSSTSAYAQLSLGFGMLTTKNLSKVVYTKMKLSAFKVCL